MSDFDANIERLNNDFRIRNNRSIKWGWFWIAYNVVFGVWNAVLYITTGSVVSLVVGILFVGLLIASAFIQRWNYMQRWYRLGTQRRRTTN